MVQIIKPKSNPQSSGETQADKIPTDPDGIKKHLEVIPEPVGYRMLVRPYQPAEKTKGGVILADQTAETIQMTTVCAYVLKLGPLAYKDTDKFSTGPWCKEGDWIIFGRYAGSRFKIEGAEVRILNDDEIIATISNPEDILHLY